MAEMDSNDLNPTASVQNNTDAPPPIQHQDQTNADLETKLPQEGTSSNTMDTIENGPTGSVPLPQATGGLSPPAPLGNIDTNKPIPFIRSQSPAKRPASEMNGGDETGDYPMSPMSNNEQGGVALNEPEFLNTGSAPYPAQTIGPSPPTTASSATVAPESAPEVANSTASIPDGDPAISTASTVEAGPSSVSSPPPTLEQQLSIVLLGIHRPIVEGQDYCVISGKWLKKFLAAQSNTEIQLTKEEAEGELGPIDNSDVVDKAALEQMQAKGVNFLITKPPKASDGELAEQSADAGFVPIVEGVQGEDFDIIPVDTWDELVKWHGLAPGTPPAIKRKAVNTNAHNLQAASNIQVELYPPTFTIYKLRDPSAEQTHASLSGAVKPPPKIIASRSERVQDLLRKAKHLTDVDLPRKVRLWRFPNGRPLPNGTSSRSSSPSKGKKALKNSKTDTGMIMDMSTFLDMERDSERELIEMVQDNTNNKFHNGKMTINSCGLGDGGDLLLEEQDPNGQWISERVSKVLGKSGGGVIAKINSLVGRKGNSANSSRSSSPARNTSQFASSSGPTSIMSRGREKRPGRPIGACGLQNLGNTCYMNSALQCLRNCEELSKYFLSGKFKSELNPSNPLAHGGNIARSYANLLGYVFNSSCPASYAPREFKNTIGRFGPSFSGYGQQDSQEFLAFLLDGLHEDLNRIRKKPYIEKPESTDEMVNDEKAISDLADKCWDIYKARNDSAVADLFGGLYKSTLVCPKCAKVSITFDPFMDLTLPLPIENVWSKEVTFYPRGGKSLLKIPVDLDKNSSIKGLKEYIGTKLQIDPKRMMGSEMYKSKFFKHYDDNKGVSAEIGSNDTPVFYELEDVPTNFPSRKARFSRTFDWDEDVTSQMAEKMMVPIFNKKRGRINDYFGLPYFIMLDKEEQKDFSTILFKVCERLQSQTSRVLFENDEEEDSAGTSGVLTPDNENVVVNAEDESINEGKRVKENEEEDGYIDVQMEDVGEITAQKKKRKPYSQRAINKLRGLFTMKVASKAAPDVGVLTGWSEMNATIEVASRIRRPTPPPPTLPMRKNFRPNGRAGVAGSDESEEDYELEEPFVNSEESLQQESDEEATKINHSYNKQGTLSTVPVDTFYGTKKGNNKKSKLYRDQSPGSSLSTPPPMQQEQGPLIRLGEGIICEWDEQSYDDIFGGRNKDDFRGIPLDPQLFVDAELEAKRRLRDSRRKRGIHLDDCLAEFAKEEILSETDPWYCPRCKEHRRASKKFELWKSPDILVIHLKRFSSSRISRDKIDVLIDFPVEGLDLTDRVGKQNDGKELIYDLFAVDNHYGGLGGGHYTAYAKNYEDGKWYHFDDSSVSQTNPSNVTTSAAYLLFYRRRSNKPLGGPLFEKIMGESGEDALRESGNGENGNDSGISDNSPSSSPGQGGQNGRRDSSDLSVSSSPLVSGHGSSGYRSFAGAGSSTTLFDTPSSPLAPSSAKPPSYAEATEDRLFGPALPNMYDGQVVYTKPVNFQFGSSAFPGLGGENEPNSGLPTTPASTAGDLGDDDLDGDAEDDVDMLADEAMETGGVDSEDVKYKYIVADGGVGGEDNDDGVEEVKLSPEQEPTEAEVFGDGELPPGAAVEGQGSMMELDK